MTDCWAMFFCVRHSVFIIIFIEWYYGLEELFHWFHDLVVHVKIVMCHVLVDYHVAVRQMVKRFVCFFLEISLINQSLKQDVAVLRRDKSVSLTVY